MTNKLDDRKVVVGLGKTGLTCVRYLKSNGFNVAVTDSRENPPELSMLQQNYPDVEVAVGAISESLLDQASEMIISPGVSLKTPAILKQIQRGVPGIGDIELFARQVTKPIIAITGSNGKSTVTTLVGMMIQQSGQKAAVCGNIGYPVLDFIDQPQPDYYVMELSSFQLETTFTLQPEVSVILNVSPDHMDRYANFEEYLAAKQRIYRECRSAIVNAEEPGIWRSLIATPACSFTLNLPQDKNQFGLIKMDEQLFLAKGQHCLMPAEELKLQGWHHLQNALAALAIGETIHLPLEGMLQVIKNFTGLKHRCQWVAKKRGVDWYNDSKGTNVGATVSAIRSLSMINQKNKGNMILIVGGDSKEADLLPLQEPLKQCISHVFLFGKDAPKMEASFQGIVSMTRVDNLQSAVTAAANLASVGDLVLLSPACASYDMFKNFEHRGDVFIQLVEDLPE